MCGCRPRSLWLAQWQRFGVLGLWQPSAQASSLRCTCPTRRWFLPGPCAGRTRGGGRGPRRLLFRESRVVLQQGWRQLEVVCFFPFFRCPFIKLSKCFSVFHFAVSFLTLKNVECWQRRFLQLLKRPFRFSLWSVATATCAHFWDVGRNQRPGAEPCPAASRSLPRVLRGLGHLRWRRGPVTSPPCRAFEHLRQGLGLGSCWLHRTHRNVLSPEDKGASAGWRCFVARPGAPWAALRTDGLCAESSFPSHSAAVRARRSSRSSPELPTLLLGSPVALGVRADDR